MKILKRILFGIAVIILIFEISLVLTGNLYVNKVLAMTIFSGKLGPDIENVK